MLQPQSLQKGDTVGVIAPASPPDMKRLYQAIPFLENLGLRVKLGKHIENVHGYLAGTDAERLADFHDMIQDDTVKAIIFARGGYGTGRIASNIDFDLIKKNPKIIWGYSDITYLHTAICQKAGLVTFHGPMVASDVADPDFDDISSASFQQLFEPTTLTYSEDISPLETLVEGKATGELVGGNLALLVSTLGTDFEIHTKGKLLLLEDIHEQPYRIDSMLNQLKLAGKLEQAAGIIIGDFADAKPKHEPSLSLEEIFTHYLGGLSCPVMAGFKIGHCFPHFAVPFGVEATLSTEKKSLVINPGVQ
ncbi:S66 peptidase family protein [Ornithinibacillus halotolerans]|uniref:Murein peptide carboxypeptidase n=1 Tax=Ornithinibacillus halotolerans TaxID=1274357 RepID=A0A916W453_9BACI|nr:LD-carboxypeptidase [Ornithinibacillus halotolerans]GGA64416.1 putative murein peptide carboxypeptidase [Ornithinibacillus halotolerans]